MQTARGCPSCPLPTICKDCPAPTICPACPAPTDCPACPVPEIQKQVSFTLTGLDNVVYGVGILSQDGMSINFPDGNYSRVVPADRSNLLNLDTGMVLKIGDNSFNWINTGAQWPILLKAKGNGKYSLLQNGGEYELSQNI